MKYPTNQYGELFFPGKNIQKMADLGITDKDIYDVFKNGDHKKSPDGGTFAVRKYNGYEIGLFYVPRGNGEYNVTGVWKKDRN